MGGRRPRAARAGQGARRPGRAPPRGARGLAVLTCSGGDSALAADECERIGAAAPAARARHRAAAARAAPGRGHRRQPARLHRADLGRGRRRCATSSPRPAATPPSTSCSCSTTSRPGSTGRRTSPGPRCARGSSPARPRSPRPGRARLDAARAARRRRRGALRRRRDPAGRRAAHRPRLRRGAQRNRPGDPARLRAIGAAAAGRAAGHRHDGWLAEHEAKQLLRDRPACRSSRAASSRTRTTPSPRWRELGGPVAVKLVVAVASPQDRGRRARAGRSRRAGRCAPRTAGSCRSWLADGRACWSSGWRRRAPSCSWRRALDGVVPHLVIAAGGLWTEVLADAAVVPLPAAPERVERGDPRRCGPRRCSPAGAAAPRSTWRRPRRLAAAAGELLLGADLALIELNPVLVHEQRRDRGRRAGAAQRMRAAVVGAGLAGLAAADELRARRRRGRGARGARPGRRPRLVAPARQRRGGRDGRGVHPARQHGGPRAGAAPRPGTLGQGHALRAARAARRHGGHRRAAGSRPWTRPGARSPTALRT